MGKGVQLKKSLNSRIVVAAILTMCTSLARAGQGSFTNSGGSGSGGAGIVINSTVASPAGALSIDCPGSVTSCSEAASHYSSTDGSTAISASFTSGTYAESCSGGGKGGHVTCGYSLTGYFSGTLTLNGAAQAIVGITYQGFTLGGPPSGTTIYNSAYSPFYYSDTEQFFAPTTCREPTRSPSGVSMALTASPSTPAAASTLPTPTTNRSSAWTM